MNETERQQWNAVVAAARADPSDAAAAAALYTLRERLLAVIHTEIMTEDNYQERTHGSTQP